MKQLNNGQTIPQESNSGSTQTHHSVDASPPLAQSGAAPSTNGENNSPQAKEGLGHTPGLQNGQSTISMAANNNRIGSLAVLPGESGDKYLEGLISTIQELNARSNMQIYYAEKIFQRMWSMKRYEEQKRACLIAEMVKALGGSFAESADERLALTRNLEAGVWDTPGMDKRLKSKGFTPQSLTQKAFERCMDEVLRYEQLIAVAMHSMIGLQKSYESLVHRSIMQERLKLQNELLKRDLQAIDVKSRQINPDMSEHKSDEEAKDASEPIKAKGEKAFQRGQSQDNLAPSDVTPKEAKLQADEHREAEPSEADPKKADPKKADTKVAEPKEANPRAARLRKADVTVNKQESL
jgi:hypothetical protein